MHTNYGEEIKMEDFNLDMSFISDGIDINDLNPENQVEEVKEPEKQEEIHQDNGLENEITENLNIEDLNLESVGEETEEQKGNKQTENKEAPSPNNTYSSIASAFKVDGVPLFSDSDDEQINGLKSADDFEDFLKEKLEKVISDKLDETQKRINNALTYGMEPSDIQLFENSLRNLNSITDDAISDEGEDGEALRRQLIQSDLINRGFSEEKAKKLTQQSFDAGTDVDDAKDALKSNKAFYQKEYDKIFNANKEVYENNVKAQKKAAEDFKKNVLEDKKAFGEVEVDSKTRQKIFDVVAKPFAKDANGNSITEIQKYADENPVDFRKYLAYFYVLTDGFKSLNKVKDVVSKEVRKKEINALERTLNSTARNNDGSLKFMGDDSWGSDKGGEIILLS